MNKLLLPANLQSLQGNFITWFESIPIIVFIIGAGSLTIFEMALVFVSFISSLDELRAICIAQLLLCISCSRQINNFSKKQKQLFFVYLCFQCLYFLVGYGLVSYKLIVLN